MSDFKIIVEYRKTPKAARFSNEFETMYDMMDHVYRIMHGNPEAIITIKKVWWKNASS